MYSTPHQGVAHAFILRNLFDRTRGTNTTTTTTTTTTSIPHAVSHQSDWCGEGTQRSFVRSFLCSIGAGAGAGTPAVAPQPDDAQETPATTPPTAESPQPVILDDLPETEDLVTPTPSAPAPALMALAAAGVVTKFTLGDDMEKNRKQAHACARFFLRCLLPLSSWIASSRARRIPDRATTRGWSTLR